MNLLVSYDDSDSETETVSSEIHCISMQDGSKPCVPSGVDPNPSLKELPGENAGNYYLSSTLEGVTEKAKQDNLSSKDVYPRVPCARPNFGQLRPNMSCKNYDPAFKFTPDSDSVSVTGRSTVQKRTIQNNSFSSTSIKPYIPKRQRQESQVDLEVRPQEKEQFSVDPNTSEADLGCAVPVTSRVSEYIRPYLETAYTSTEIPRHLVFQLPEHKGPVNNVQWCPVQHQSHMLLSASMDKTFKVWDAVDTGTCLKSYSCHSSAVRDAIWSLCGRKILSGGFDSALYLTDTETGTHLFSSKTEFRISTVKFHPSNPNVFLCGGFSPSVNAWDIRSHKVIRDFKAAIQQTLDILFLPEGNLFFTSTDSVSRDSADRTIIAWDFQTGAKISNQIFHERYTCPSLTLHPKERAFAAQTNGNYMALFSTQRPFKINKKKRYEGHKVFVWIITNTIHFDLT
ncbi:WD repeat-containing protein 25 isoform X2 [Pleurodeles waltl]|uniref:WD repeat-containing protein 25 isoform X2 n=1 Tax=Pleurodeles waltl TaxID=8319 RepID=UPI00370955DA